MKLKWTKSGGHETSRTIVYTASEWTIIRTRIGGNWSMPVLYHNGQYVRGYKTIAEAKAAATRQS